MGIILGGIITVVGTAPLSSMALTALLGLTVYLWLLVPWQHLVRHL